jgi:hypothetical protein
VAFKQAMTSISEERQRNGRMIAFGHQNHETPPQLQSSTIKKRVQEQASKKRINNPVLQRMYENFKNQMPQIDEPVFDKAYD